MAMMQEQQSNSFGAAATLQVGSRAVQYFRLAALEEQIAGLTLKKLPFSLRVLLENLVRREDGITVTADGSSGFTYVFQTEGETAARAEAGVKAIAAGAEAMAQAPVREAAE